MDVRSEKIGSGLTVIRSAGPLSDIVTVGLDRGSPMHEGDRRRALIAVAEAIGLDFEAEALRRLPSMRPRAQGGRW